MVLDAAEAVVAKSGAAALSFATVATEAGLSKASVQSAFGTRTALIDQLINRWMAEEKERYTAALGGETSPHAHLAAHLHTTIDDMFTATGQRVATMLAVLAGHDEVSESMRAWYRQRLGDLGAAGDDAKRRRTAYLAAEGAFFLRCLVGIPVTEDTWREIFAELERFAGNP